MVHLSCNEMIPADILVLRSSDEHGLCYIDTQNLDGEANLKQREVPRGFVDRVRYFLILERVQLFSTFNFMTKDFLCEVLLSRHPVIKFFGVKVKQA